MPVVDHESVLVDLRSYLVSKNSFGQRELLLKLAEIEAGHRVDESLPEKALRMYGAELFDAVRSSNGPTTRRHAVVASGTQSRGASPEGAM